MDAHVELRILNYNATNPKQLKNLSLNLFFPWAQHWYSDGLL